MLDAPSAIGTAVTLRLARDGWPVVLHHSADEAAAERLAVTVEDLGGHAATVAGSHATPRAAGELFDHVEERWGAALVLVAGAGSIGSGRIPAAEHEPARSLHVIRRAVESMRAARCGRVVQLVPALGRPDGTWPTTRDALLGMALAPGLARRGVTVNTVAVGVIDAGPRRNLVAQACEHVPARRPGTPDEVAACVSFLAGRDASYVTGQLLFVDGGTAAARRLAALAPEPSAVAATRGA